MMKKVLSLILAIAMVLSLIPAAFAAGTETETMENFTIKYDLSQAMYELGMTTKSATNQPTTITYGVTKGFLKFAGGSYNSWSTADSSFFFPTTGTKDDADGYNMVLRGNKYVIFEVWIPAAGTYTMQVNHGTHNKSIDMKVSYKPAEATESTLLGTYNCVKGNNTNWTKIGTSTVTTTISDGGSGTTEAPATFTVTEPQAYEFTFTAVGNSSYRASVGTFSLISGNGNGAVLMPYYNGETTLEVGDTASLKGYKSSDALEAAVSYSVDGDAVSVDKATGTITAEKAGTATVTMTATDASITTGEKTYSVDITVEDAETDFVSIGVDYGDGNGVIEITEKALGDEVTVTAPDHENMVFRGWVRGSAENGHLVWTEKEYKFTAMTNTYLTAIYTPVNAAATHEYYHWNGQFLGNDKTEAEANISPIVGYTFANSWTEAKKENSITSWIADFTKNDTGYTITDDGSFSISQADDKYDTEVTCTSDSAVYWYRDDKLVDYGTEYKFFIWDNTTVKTSADGHNGAKLMLDVKKDNTYMVEYDAGDKTLLEVGILFGDSGDSITVESCKEKMSSQRSLNNPGHGQFSATSEYAVARGYLVYKDGDTYRVIYAD